VTSFVSSCESIPPHSVRCWKGMPPVPQLQMIGLPHRHRSPCRGDTSTPLRLFQQHESRRLPEFFRVKALGARVQENRCASQAGHHEASFAPNADDRQCFMIIHRWWKALKSCVVIRLGPLWLLQQHGSKARQLLAEVCGWFTERFDTAGLQVTRAPPAALWRSMLGMGVSFQEKGRGVRSVPYRSFHPT